MRASDLVLPMIVIGLLAGCAGPSRHAQPVHGRAFDIKQLAKSDVDMVADVSVSQSLAYLRVLAGKLYARNPRQYERGHARSQAAALEAMFGPGRRTRHPGLGGIRSSRAIALAFDETYTGDRVAAFIEGMRTMLLDAYGGKSRFYLHDSLDPQKLHYLARNFEIAFWKLGHDRDPAGRLYLLSNSLSGSGNLSFERLAGKLISLQDHMAQVVADRTNRHIKNVIQSVASAVFFPI